MYPAPDNDDIINFSAALPVQNNNYGARKYLIYDHRIDNKDKKAAAVEEEDLQVNMHVITKNKTLIKKMKIKGSKGTPPPSITKPRKYFRLINLYISAVG